MSIMFLCFHQVSSSDMCSVPVTAIQGHTRWSEFVRWSSNVVEEGETKSLVSSLKVHTHRWVVWNHLGFDTSSLPETFHCLGFITCICINSHNVQPWKATVNKRILLGFVSLIGKSFKISCSLILLWFNGWCWLLVQTT